MGKLFKSCIDFLNKYCVNQSAGGRLYFIVTGDGKPLRQRRYWHSEDFYVIGHAAYGALSGNKEAVAKARQYYDFVYNLNNGLIDDPVKIPPKVEPSTRKTQNLGKKMMCLNSSALMEITDPENKKLYRERAREAAAYRHSKSLKREPRTCCL
jgi:N-acylglucosamine 2-epimerase